MTSCSDFRKITKSTDWKEKYQAALKYYQEKDYYRATLLLEDVMPIIKGTKTAEEAQFYYAYAHYYQRKYILSAHYFKQFYETYSRSEQAQEAMFMHAYSLYLELPIPAWTKPAPAKPFRPFNALSTAIRIVSIKNGPKWCWPKPAAN